MNIKSNRLKMALLPLLAFSTIALMAERNPRTFKSMQEDCNFRSIQNSCMKLGLYYIEERLESRVGMKYLEKSCILGSGVGCMAMGEIHKNGSYGVKIDYEESKDYYNKSCLSGLKLGCKAYNSLYLGDYKKEEKSDFWSWLR